MSHNPHPPGHGDAGRQAETTGTAAARREHVAPPHFPAVNRQPLTRREAREARAVQEAAAAAAAAAAGAPSEATSPRAPGAEGSDDRRPGAQPVDAAIAPLDFDAVMTGPVPEQSRRTEEPAPAVSAAEAHPFAALLGPDADDDAASAESPLVWRQQNYLSHDEPRRRKRSLKPLWVTLVIVAILAGMVGGAYAVFQPQVAQLVNALTPKDNDYKGNGTGQVMFTIHSGDTGSDVATNLQKNGVTKSFSAFYTLLLRQKPQVQFQPGVFKLAKQMSAQAALLALEDPASKIQRTAVVPEGTAEKDIIPILATATGLSATELQAAAANPAQYGVPPEAKTLEGFLFPATYTFSPGISAHDVIKTLVDRSFQSLDQAGVAPADRWKTVVLASVVQREAGLAPDYPKVARVFLNRLAQGWDLQSDATVAYGTGHTNRVSTTDAERADASNPYNTYVHPGLPVGPISNPGDLAINAAVHPADGPWMFFVTWNLKTGETIFSTTEAEHEAAVAKWQQWMKDNPGYG